MVKSNDGKVGRQIWQCCLWWPKFIFRKKYPKWGWRHKYSFWWWKWIYFLYNISATLSIYMPVSYHQYLFAFATQEKECTERDGWCIAEYQEKCRAILIKHVQKIIAAGDTTAKRLQELSEANSKRSKSFAMINRGITLMSFSLPTTLLCLSFIVLSCLV